MHYGPSGPPGGGLLCYESIVDTFRVLSETFEVPEQVTWLFKQWFDNVASYMSKKEERLKGEKKEKVSEESSPKRLKTSLE